MESLDRKRARILLAMLLLATAAIYSPSLYNGFTYDDQFYAKAEYRPGHPNEMIAELQPISEYFSSFFNRGIFVAGYEYRPVTVYSFALVYHGVGRHFQDWALGESLPQHLVNLLLHLLAVCLTYRLLRALSCGRSSALLGAAAFAIHAIHSEPVVAIVGRAELFSFCFGCGGLLLAYRAQRKTGRAAVVAILVANVLFFLAFCSKENALAWLPALLIFLLVVVGRKGQATRLSRERIREAAASVLTVAAIPLASFLFLRARMISLLEAPVPIADPMANPLAHVPMLERVLSSVMINGYGLILTLLPFKLSSDYDLAVFPILSSVLDLRFLAAAALLIGLLSLAIAVLRSRPIVFFAAAVFFGFSFLVSNIPVVIGTPFAERLYYTPSLALSILIAGLAPSFSRNTFARRGAAVAGVAWAAACCTMVVERAQLWRDNETLYTHDAQTQPRSARLQYHMADFAMFAGDTEKQFHHMQQAFRLKPEVTRAWLRFAWFLPDPNKALEATRRGLGSAKGPDSKYRFHLFWTRSQVLAAQGRAMEGATARALAVEQLEWLLENPAERAELRDALAVNEPSVSIWLAASDHLAALDRNAIAQACVREALAYDAKALDAHRIAAKQKLDRLVGASHHERGVTGGST